MRPYKHFVMFAALAAVVVRRRPPATQRGSGPWPASRRGRRRLLRAVLRPVLLRSLVRRLSVPDSIRTATAIALGAGRVGPTRGEAEGGRGLRRRLLRRHRRRLRRHVPAAERVAPGEHEIELWLDGYRTVRQKVYLTRDNTFKVKYQMEHLAAGEAPEPKPQPLDAAAGGNQPRCSRSSSRWDADRRRAGCRRHRRRSSRSRCRDDPRGGTEAQRGGQRNGGLRHARDQGAAGRRRDVDRRRSLARSRRPGSPDGRSRRRLAHRRDSQVRLSAPTSRRSTSAAVRRRR